MEGCDIACVGARLEDLHPVVLEWKLEVNLEDPVAQPAA